MEVATEVVALQVRHCVEMFAIDAVARTLNLNETLPPCQVAYCYYEYDKLLEQCMTCVRTCTLVGMYMYLNGLRKISANV